MDELLGKLPATLIEFIQRPRGEWDQIDLDQKDAGEADSAARKNSEKRRKAVRKAMGYSYP